MSCFLALILFLSLPVSGFEQTSNSPTAIYKSGLAEVENGNVEEALKIWISVLDIEDPMLRDPKIGFAYVETVVENLVKEEYENACKMYFWAIEDTDATAFRDELLDEVERLRPILGNAASKEIRSLIKSNDSLYKKKLANFWREMDPTMSEGYNERLLEHWERIVYSKQTFTLANNTIYGTDDRAVAFIKYGMPYKKKSGRMRYDAFLIKSWLSELSQLTALRETSVAELNANFSGQVFNDPRGRELQSSARARDIRQYFDDPYFDIWVYKELDGLRHEENLIFIFGEEGDTGRFQRLNSIEDFIDRRGFRDRFEDGSTPALFLQMMINNQLSIIDFHFDLAYQRLATNFFSQNNKVSRQLSMSERSLNAALLNQRYVRAPVETSEYNNLVSNLTINQVSYRFLDDSNQPYLKTYFYISPKDAILYDYVKRNAQNKQPTLFYYVNSALKYRDTQNEDIFMTDVSSDTVALIEYMGNDERVITVSTEIEHPQKVDHYTLYSELKGFGEQEVLNPEITQYFPEDLLGHFKVPIEVPKRLDNNQKKLILSDIILGEPGYQNQLITNYDNQFSSNSSLLFNFELYHLSNSAEVKNFVLSYQVKKKNKRIFKGDEDSDVKLELNFSTLEENYSGLIEVDNANLVAGDYILDIKILEPITGREVNREVEFSIKG